jgi:hypothetical protein
LEREERREELKDELERYRRRIDPALDRMTLESTRELVRAIEEKMHEAE